MVVALEWEDMVMMVTVLPVIIANICYIIEQAGNELSGRRCGLGN